MTVTLGITGVEEWMYEDFETYIDNFGLAFMELNDVAKWLLSHGFDLKVALKESDAEREFAKKADVQPKDYVLGDEDYYRRKTTILNSEVAALARCLALEAKLKDGDMFFDVEFGPASDDDEEGSKRSLYCKGITP